MGKKRKCNRSNSDLNTGANVKIKKVKTKDINTAAEQKIEEDSLDQNEAVIETTTIASPSKPAKKKKNNKIFVIEPIVENEEVTLENDSTPVESFNSKTINSKKKKKPHNPNKEEAGPNTKITFSDDVPTEENTKKRRKKKANKKDLSQEDDVKDEDIDEFCDEINEEDNVQYENWVQLIEAKLSGNKNKST